MIEYNKIVRDKIPEIIEKSGKTCEIEIVSDEKSLVYLEKKLQEELDEYMEIGKLEELADLLEVIEAVALKKGSSLEEVMKIKEEKKEKRGGFEKNILLKKVS
jgi:predicted house-cleaning noncanonical NTP pyrophosphatase (MazG superfamily)